MAVFSTFKGMRPAYGDLTNTQDNSAAFASNCDLSTGSIIPRGINTARQATTILPTTQTKVVRFGAQFVGLPAVSVTRSPLVDDAFSRIYYNDAAGASWVRYGPAADAVVRRLGVPRPGGLTVDRRQPTLGNPTGESPVFTFFAVTWVNTAGEEGAPSDPSNEVEMYSNTVARVLRPAAPATNYGVNRWRIYRANDGVWQFVSEHSIATTRVDVLRDAPLGEELETLDWDVPPSRLLGLSMSPNGFLTGYFDRTVCFSESYVPHAWPVIYRRNTRFDIMGVTNTRSGSIIVTTGKPYVALGSAPSAMQLIEGDTDYGCTSRESIVGMGEFALYASQVGIMMVDSSGTTRNMTEGLVRPDQWPTLFPPATIRAVRFQDRYLFQAGSAGDVYSIDTTNGHMTQITPKFTLPLNTEYDTETNQTYYVTNREIWGLSLASRQASWRSAVFTGAKRINPHWAQVAADNYPITLKVTAIGEGATVERTYSVTDKRPFRLHPMASGGVSYAVDTQFKVDRIVLTNDESELMAWQ